MEIRSKYQYRSLYAGRRGRPDTTTNNPNKETRHESGGRLSFFLLKTAIKVCVNHAENDQEDKITFRRSSSRALFIASLSSLADCPGKYRQLLRVLCDCVSLCLIRVIRVRVPLPSRDRTPGKHNKRTPERTDRACSCDC